MSVDSKSRADQSDDSSRILLGELVNSQLDLQMTL